MAHEIIKCGLYEYHMLRTKLKDQYVDVGLCHVPNSLGGKPHPQFTIKTEQGKITYFMVKK